MGCHGWDEFRALSARLNFDLNKKRALLSPSKRKSKQRCYTKQQFPIKGCLKEVMRLPNHLRQTHKVKKGSRVKRLMMECEPIIRKHVEEDSDSNVSLESSDSDDTYDSVQKVFHQNASYDNRQVCIYPRSIKFDGVECDFQVTENANDLSLLSIQSANI